MSADGTVCHTAPNDIMHRWHEHASMLLNPAAAPPADLHLLPSQYQPPLAEFGDAITAAEIVAAIEAMDVNRAAGPDGFPPLLAKLIIHRVTEGGVSRTAFADTPYARARSRLLLAAAHTGIYPTAGKESKTTLILKPARSADNCNNYRGIAAIPQDSRIIDGVVATRLSTILTQSGRFSETQFGFRPKEEAAMVAVALLVLTAHAHSQGRQLIAAATDIEKAFDKLQHDVMLEAARRIGVNGVTLRLITDSYTGATTRIGMGTHTSELISINQGVRQGAPSSPLLWNIAANDLVRRRCLPAGAMEALPDGVGAVPIPVAEAHADALRILGFQFADDSTTCSHTLLGTQAGLDRFDATAAKLRIKVETSKSSVALFAGSAADAAALRAGPPSLAGSRIPVADSLNILGIAMKPLAGGGAIDLEYMVEHMVDRLKAAKEEWRAALTNPALSPIVKAHIIRCHIIPAVAYGAELVGVTTPSAVVKPSNALDRVLLIAATGLDCSRLRSAAALYVELNIHTVRATFASRHARALAKYPRSPTQLRALLASPAGTSPTGWLCEGRAVIATLLRKTPEWDTVDPRTLALEARDAQTALDWATKCKDRANGTADWGAAGWYNECDFKSTRHWLRDADRHHWRQPVDRAAVAYLLRARTRTASTAIDFALHRGDTQVNLIKKEYETKCPHCGTPWDTACDYAHLLLDCDATEMFRKEANAPDVYRLIDCATTAVASRAADRYADILDLGHSTLSLILGGRSRHHTEVIRLSRWCKPEDGPGAAPPPVAAAPLAAAAASTTPLATKLPPYLVAGRFVAAVLKWHLNTILNPANKFIINGDDRRSALRGLVGNWKPMNEAQNLLALATLDIDLEAPSDGEEDDNNGNNADSIAAVHDDGIDWNDEIWM